MKYSLFALLILAIASTSFGRVNINYIYEWRFAEFLWDSAEQKQAAISSGNYDPYKCLFYDAIKANDGRVFITLPRELGPGSPATLTTVSNITGLGGPLLRPYPNWSWHNRSCMCDNIVNVHRVDIKCNYLFVLDNGKIGNNQVCNPKLLIFNLKTDTLVKTIYIPIDIATNRTGSGLLIMPLVYVPGSCSRLNEIKIFMADMQGSGIVVYDLSTNRICRVESDYIKPQISYAIVSIANETLFYKAGIFSMTFLKDELYFAPMSGNQIYKTNIKTLLKCPNKKEANKQTKPVIKLSSQTGQITSAGQAILYSDSRALSIKGTNIRTKKTVVLAQNSKTLQAVSALKVSGKKVTYMSDRFPRYALNTVNLFEVNVRYFEMNLADVLKETNSISRITPF